MDLRENRNRPFSAALMLIAVVLGLAGLASSAQAADGGPWSVRVEPVHVDVEGHDPTLGSVSGSGNLGFTTDSGTGYHFELKRDRGERWGWGLDFFWYTGAQNSPLRTDSGTAASPVSYAFVDGAYTSTGPDEVLFFERQPDTDMNAWTVDLYAIRTLSSGRARLLFGVRNADFDNDSRAVVGLEGLRGTRLDASSNYSRMIGPLVGVAVDRERGKNRFELTLTQSVVSGDSDLTASQSDFLGPFTGEDQTFTAVRHFTQPKSVSIPITELRARWSYAVTRSISLGLGAHLSVWTDVGVPPGQRPTGALDSLYETTITFQGLVGAIEIDL